MRVRSHAEYLDRQSKALLKNLNKLRIHLDIPHSQYRHILQLTDQQYESTFKGDKTLPVTSLVHLAEHFQISLEGLIRGEIDYEALLRHHSGDEAYLPERYSVAAFSRKRTASNLLDFVEIIRGYDARSWILRRFQLKEAMFANPGGAINIHLISDLFQHLSRTGLFQNEHFRSMGAHTVKTYRGSSLASTLGKIGTPRGLFEHLVENSEFYEKNCQYRFQALTQTTCIIESVPNRDVAEALQSKQLGVVEGCHFRAGVFASLPAYAELPFAEVTKTACVFQGDQACRFLVDFGRPHHAHRTRLNPLYN